MTIQEESIQEEQEDQKLLISIYRVDKDNFDFTTFDEIINQIMSKDLFYKQEEVLNDNKMRLFYKESSSNYKKWNNFFEWKIKEDNFFTYTDDQTWEVKIKASDFISFVCFFEIEDEIFIVSSWKSYILFDRWCDQYFWLNIITRLLDKNSKSLKHLLDNSLSWSNFESSFIFRNNESFLSQDDFWKIFKESIAELTETQLSSIWIDTTWRIHKKINCLAKTNFTPKTWITFSELKNKILPKVALLLKNDPKFKINQVKEINKKDLLYPKLLDELFNKMYANLLEFDFFPPKDIWEFFNASKYLLFWEEISYEDFDLTIVDKIKTIIDWMWLDLNSFKSKLETTYVNSFDEEWSELLSQKFALYRWLHWEIDYEWLHYFWLNWKFWKIEKNFLDDFNSKAFEILKNNKLETTIILPLNKIWENENEWPYNENHKDKFIVLDKKRVFDIEFCDLIYFNTKQTFIIHVKRWFDRDMRVLSSQILTSARVLTEVRRWDMSDDFLKQLYSKKITDLTITESEFLELFWKDREINFILAYTVWNPISTIDDIKKLKSNIAKLELFETFKEFKKFDPPFKLKIFEIKIKP